MPAYEFVNAKHGVTQILRLPSDKLPNRIVLTRVRIPSGVTIGTGAKAPTHSDKLAAGYKYLESKGSFNGKQKPGQLDVKTIKKAIAMPDTD